MKTLDELAEALRRELPGLEVEVVGGGLTLSRPGMGEVVRLDKEQISTLSAKERRRCREQGLGYLDLGTGAVYVDEPGVLLYLTVQRRGPTRLTPYQCALLGAILTVQGAEWFLGGLAGSQVDLIRRVKLELGVDVQPMTMSRFIDALGRTGTMGSGARPRWKTSKALDAIRCDFQLSKVGRAANYAGRYEEVENKLSKQLGSDFATGVARAVYYKAAAWIEPPDYLIEPSALPEVERLLGAPVRKGYAGPMVVLRVAQNVPLRLLTLGEGQLQPILGIAEATRGESSVARQKAREVWQQWKSEWK